MAKQHVDGIIRGADLQTAALVYTVWVYPLCHLFHTQKTVVLMRSGADSIKHKSLRKHDCSIQHQSSSSSLYPHASLHRLTER